jgi:hypothetical protein
MVLLVLSPPHHALHQGKSRTFNLYTMHYIKGKTELLTSTPCITSREKQNF